MHTYLLLRCHTEVDEERHEHGARDGGLDDVGSIETVDTVRPHHTRLLREDLSRCSPEVSNRSMNEIRSRGGTERGTYPISERSCARESVSLLICS